MSANKIPPRRIIIIVAALLLMLGPVGVVFAFPMAGAVACPSCFGFERLEENVYVERDMSTEARIHVADVLAEARGRVRAFYDGGGDNARTLVCGSEDCYRRVGGRAARATSFLDLALRFSPRGIDPVIASHELSHIELHRRLGRWLTVVGAVPAWFDEGVAVVVSDDPRYLAPVGNADRCLEDSDEPLPTRMSEWNRRAREDEHLYAKAACRVARWVSSQGGPAAVTRLLTRISAGTAFADAYARAQ